MVFVKISSVANAREPLARCPERGFYQFKKGCFRTLVKTTILMKSVVVNPRQMLSSVIIIIHHITIRPHRSTLPTKKTTPLGFLRPLRIIFVSWGSCVPSAFLIVLRVLGLSRSRPTPNYLQLYTSIYNNYIQTYNYPTYG